MEVHCVPQELNPLFRGTRILCSRWEEICGTEGKEGRSMSGSRAEFLLCIIAANVQGKAPRGLE